MEIETLYVAFTDIPRLDIFSRKPTFPEFRSCAKIDTEDGLAGCEAQEEWKRICGTRGQGCRVIPPALLACVASPAAAGALRSPHPLRAERGALARRQCPICA